MGNLTFLLTYLVISFLLAFAITPFYIYLLHRFRLGKNIREEATIGKAKEFFKLHQHKSGTPTLGGGMILLVVFSLVVVSMALQAFSPQIEELIGFKLKYSLFNRNETYLSLFTLFTVGIIGAIDDFMNVRGLGRTKGISARLKMLLLIIFSSFGAYWFFAKLGFSTLHLPFFGDIALGIWYVPLFILVIISMANSVNITDGLDGLAGGLLLFCYTVYAYLTFVKGLLILSALCMLIIGALIAFLWFNIKPAHFYMGDVWSLALGANLWVMAMMTNTLVVLFIISLIFILEMLSSLIQIISKKYRNGKKIFLIVPFHHHLEALGWKEETIVMRFWLVGIILSAVGLIVGLVIK